MVLIQWDLSGTEDELKGALLLDQLSFRCLGRGGLSLHPMTVHFFSNSLPKYDLHASHTASLPMFVSDNNFGYLLMTTSGSRSLSVLVRDVTRGVSDATAG